MSAVKLIVGLGNPGARYAQTRHNLGMQFIDQVMTSCDGHWSLQAQRMAWVAQITLAQSKVWAAKPLTMMNGSGRSIQALLAYWRLPADELLIVHDDLDLPPGVARLKFDGGHGGQNGLRDVMACLGHGRFHRLRLGIGHPGRKHAVVDWVLSPPSQGDAILMARAIDQAMQVLPLLLVGQVNAAVQQLHSVSVTQP